MTAGWFGDPPVEIASDDRLCKLFRYAGIRRSFGYDREDLSDALEDVCLNTSLGDLEYDCERVARLCLRRGPSGVNNRLRACCPTAQSQRLPMQIRRIRDCEHDLVRELRIAALRDAPTSFAESVHDASGRPESYWVELTRSLADKHVMFLAEEGGEARGSVYGIRDQDNSNGGRVGGMWVDSQHRARGLGTALLEAVVQWAMLEGFSAIRLWVPPNSQEAKALYVKAGFVPTGDTKSVPGDLAFVVNEMVLNLSPSESAA